jgi:hypothetical protein
MFQDFKDLLSILNARRVKYLVVGDYAVSYHAQPRATKDLDVLVQAAPKNASALYAALQEFGAPVRSITPADFLEPGTFFRVGRPPVAIDILPEIKGIQFQAAWKRRVRLTVDAKARLRANFISPEDLISAKLAAGRPVDIADVSILRDAMRRRRRRPARRGKQR